METNGTIRLRIIPDILARLVGCAREREGSRPGLREVVEGVRQTLVL
jgi:hypothetical protein